MNDRFKFRVWSIANKKYCHFATMDLSAYGLLRIERPLEQPGYIEDYENRYVIQQSTGLKDKSGKLIYEGDIVQIIEDEIPYIIEYEQDRAMFIIHSEIDRVCCNFDNYSGSELEVIGNIYESEIPYGLSETSPDSEQMEQTGVKPRQRHSVSVEEFQDNKELLQ